MPCSAGRRARSRSLHGVGGDLSDHSVDHHRQPKAALAFADRMAAEPVFGEHRTSISTALYAAEKMIDENNIASHRRVIDASGSGPTTTVEDARDFVVKQGIIINGLPIMLEQGNANRRGMDVDHLDRYYKGCVIGGTGSFISPVFSLQQLAATIRKKLVLEIAGRELPGAAPVQYGAAKPQPGQAALVPAQLKLPTEKQDCLAGKKRMRGGGYGGFPGFQSPTDDSAAAFFSLRKTK